MECLDRSTGSRRPCLAGAGSPAHEVEELVLRGFGPRETSRLTTPIDLGGAGLTEVQAVEWAETVMSPTPGEAVEKIIGWRALGLPADPPRVSWMTLHEMRPADAEQWLADGFTIEEVSQLHGLIDRDGARRWRQMGYAAEGARALLLADRTLTPDEASAFEEAGVEADSVIRWVEAGFSAHEARAWTGVDVLPNEARVWRSVGLGPEDARRQKATGGGALPKGVALGWASYGQAREGYQYGATDPPGTRGSLAAVQREFIDMPEEG